MGARGDHYDRSEVVSERQGAIQGHHRVAAFLLSLDRDVAANILKNLKEDVVVMVSQAMLDLDPRQGRYYDLVGRLSDCLGEKTERVAGLVFSRALSSGEVVPSENLRAHRETYGPSSGLVRKHREEGEPEEVRVFTDATGGEYATWFYWSRGKAFAFYNGEKKYETSFKPQREAEGSGTD